MAQRIGESAIHLKAKFDRDPAFAQSENGAIFSFSILESERNRDPNRHPYRPASLSFHQRLSCSETRLCPLARNRLEDHEMSAHLECSAQSRLLVDNSHYYRFSCSVAPYECSSTTRGCPPLRSQRSQPRRSDDASSFVAAVGSAQCSTSISNSSRTRRRTRRIRSSEQTRSDRRFIWR